MGLFIGGFFAGGILVFFIIVFIISANSIDEKEQEIKRLRQELEEQKNER